MKFKNKNKENKPENKVKNINEIEIVIGDNSNLTISDVGDCVNELRPKKCKKNNLVIPKNKKQK